MRISSLRGAQTGNFVIPANGSFEVPVVGEFVRCLSATDDFILSLNDDAEIYFDAGIEYRLDAPQELSKFRLINRSGAAINVLMAWGFGELRDGRFSLNGSVNSNIINTPTVTVGNVSALTDPITNLLKNDEQQRTPLTTLAGASYASADNAINNVVTSGANVNGIILRFFGVAANGSGNARVEVGGNIMLMSYAQSNTSDSKVEKDVFIPAGQSLTLVSTVVGNKAWAFYEVL